ncbi:hypothetical protein ACWCW7_34470 [Nocardia tengchongensis]
MTAPLTKVEILAKLRDPFAEHQIGKLPKPKKRDAAPGNCNECGGWHGLPAFHLDYVGHAAVTDRLLDVDVEWTWEPLAFDAEGLPKFDSNGGLWIRLSVAGQTRIGYGDAQGKRGGDAVKEAIGDAIRNAAMRFGVALDLWHKGDLHPTGDSAPVQLAARGPADAAGAARQELLDLLAARKISPNDAVERFAADGHGDIGRSTDVAAIKALTEHYRNTRVRS